VTRRPGSVLAPSGAGLLAAGVLAAGLLGGDAPAMAAPAAPWRVAVLMGSDAGLPAMHEIDRSFRRTLQAAAPAGATFFTDTLDTYRFDYGDLAPEFLALQRKKYGGQPVDLVVGVGERAIDAVREQREALWPGVPLILAGLDEPTVERARVPVGALQSFWQLDIDGTLALIERLQPTATRLVVVSGNAEGDLALGTRVGALATTRGRWRIEPWAGLPIGVLLERLARLGPETAVFFTHMARDANGPTPFPAEVLPQLAAASGAPIYGLFGSFVGRGLTAGSVVDFEAAGRHTAKLAIALLEGRPPPAVSPDATTRCTADLGLFARHGLDTAALQAGCTTVNPPRSLWTEYRAFVLVSSAVVAAQALTIGGLLVQRQRRRRAEQDRRDLAGRLIVAQEDERRRIAHELHDDVQQRLASISLRVSAAKRAAPEAAPALSSLLEDTLRLTSDLRHLSHDLHPPVLEHGGLAVAIRGRLAELHDHEGIAVDLRVGDGWIEPPPAVALGLYRVAQEALQNVSRHAKASTAHVTLATAGTSITMRIVDDGQGFEAQAVGRHRGIGLASMQERIRMLGGQVVVQSAPGQGTELRVSLPIGGVA